MLFGRGQWAIFGIEQDTLIEFQKALADPIATFQVSQLAASITTKFQSQPTIGINPFGSPRLDEQLTDATSIAKISELLVKFDGGDISDDIGVISEHLMYVGSESDFALGNNKYGLWFVSNEYEDPSDPNSKREQIAYADRERPFKFLAKEEKTAIEDQVTASAVLNRSQFAVLLDFQNGRAYVATSNKDEVVAVQELLTGLGVKTKPLVWDFKYPTWPGEFINRIAKDTHYASDMQKRAEELSRFSSDEVEKLEDKQLEKIVSTFFALAPMETELWAGLTTPARIRIHKPIDPVGVSNPSVAFSLLSMSNDAEVASASVVFQELAIRNTKDGEKTIRKDVFTIDINDNVNLQEAGAAMLRGFDLPQFKRDIKVAIKAKGRVGINDFWAMWLDGINTAILEFVDNVTSVLDVDKSKYGLVIPEYTANNDVLVEDEEFV